MYGLYSPILILQGFCLYHAYRNNEAQKWYWLILFLPVVGCLIYLYHNFYSRHAVENVAEGVKHLVNSNYGLRKLEKEAKYSGTVTNKTLLADAYTGAGRYKEAIELYESCLTGINTADPALMKKLLKVYFLDKNYERAVACGEKLEREKTFQNSEEKAAYAWSLYFLDQADKAEATFEALDVQFANFEQRLEYCRFLIKLGRAKEAKSKLAQMLEEIEMMDNYEKRLKQPVKSEIKKLHAGISKGK